MIDPHDLFSDKLTHVYRRTGTIFLNGLGVGVVMAGVLLTELGWLPVLAWLAFMLATTGYHCWRGQRLVSGEFRIMSGASLTPLLFMSALAGAGWGASAFFLPFVSPHLQMFIMMTIMAVAASSLPRMAALPMVLNTFMAALFLPLLAALLMFFGIEHWKMAAVVLVIWGGLVFDVRRVHADLAELYCSQQCLQNEAVIDKLTNLPNRRSFDAALEREWRRAQRFGAPLSMVMIDVDFFKKFNDRYGHQAGDACLARVAGVLADYQRRAGDLVARYGGEEFVMLLPAPRDDAYNIAGDLCRAVEALAIPHEDGPAGVVTISSGGATCIPGQGNRAEDLLKAADVALYEAKAGGRNQVRWSAASY